MLSIAANIHPFKTDFSLEIARSHFKIKSGEQVNEQPGNTELGSQGGLILWFALEIVRSFYNENMLQCYNKWKHH